MSHYAHAPHYIGRTSNILIACTVMHDLMDLRPGQGGHCHARAHDPNTEKYPRGFRVKACRVRVHCA